MHYKVQGMEYPFFLLLDGLRLSKGILRENQIISDQFFLLLLDIIVFIVV